MDNSFYVTLKKILFTSHDFTMLSTIFKGIGSILFLKNDLKKKLQKKSCRTLFSKCFRFYRP
jgi:hypothetical protein